MTDPILKITDGDIEFDLLNDTYGLSLNSWRQQLINFKNGGTYRDNPLADQRRLVDTKWSNAIETLTVKDKNVDVNTLIEVTQNLLRLLEKAVDYWTTDWQNTPVFLVARAACETNARYALIINYRLPDLPSPYEQPFLQPGGEPVWDDYDIILEREHWTKNQPGTGTAVPISATSTYNGVTYGNVDSDEDRETVTGQSEMFVANYRSEANITHVYVDDGGVFGGNLMGAAVPFNLLPAAAIAVNDAVYFGIDTTVANSGPFQNLVFDIGTAGAGYDGAWEFWNGAAWAAADTQDNTDAGGDETGAPFDTAGVALVRILPDPTWATTIVNGVTAYWVRMRVTSAPGGYTSPTQQNRNVYSATWPYFEVQAADLGGDIPALLRTELTNESDDGDGVGCTGMTGGVIMGARSVSRGSNFSAFINLADEQNPSGITVTPSGWGAFATNVWAPTGRAIDITPVGAGSSTIVDVQIDSTISDEYKGRFRVLIRVDQTVGSVGDMSLSLQVKPLADISFVPDKNLLDTPFIAPTTTSQTTIDFGILDCQSNLGDNVYSLLRFRISASAVSSTPRMTIFDLILIPVDEWAGQYYDEDYGRCPTGDDVTQYLRIDSLVTKYDVRATIHNRDDDFTGTSMQVISGRHVMSPNTRLRVWMLSVHSDGSDSDFYMFVSPQVTANQRYLNMRGER